MVYITIRLPYIFFPQKLNEKFIKNLKLNSRRPLSSIVAHFLTILYRSIDLFFFSYLITSFQKVGAILIGLFIQTRLAVSMSFIKFFFSKKKNIYN